MPQKASRPSPPRPAASPGRPKDLAKRAAILEAAERMFLQQGYEGVSMDQIAAEAARAYCEQQMPASVFDPKPSMPLRERLLEVARAFFAMVSAPEAVAGHRLLCTPQMVEKRLARAFWGGGPMRVQAAFVELLRRRMAIGELEIDDVPRASAQFFTLLKGDLHMRLVLDCCDAPEDECAQLRDAHLEAAVDMFLRAYGRSPQRT